MDMMGFMSFSISGSNRRCFHARQAGSLRTHKECLQVAGHAMKPRLQVALILEFWGFILITCADLSSHI